MTYTGQQGATTLVAEDVQQYKKSDLLITAVNILLMRVQSKSLLHCSMLSFKSILVQ